MIFNFKDVELYYEIRGEGVPIVMIHGCRPDHRLMKGCMEPIFKSIKGSWKRIYFDLPGMGKTKSQSWINNSDDMLEIILKFIDEIIPGQNFILAGESYGGYLARGIIKKHFSKVDGLLLICPVAEPEHKKATLPAFQVFEKDESLLKSLSEEDKRQFEFINVIQNKNVWKRFNNEILPALKIADSSFIDERFGNSFSFSFNIDELENPFIKPALIITGRQDFIVGYYDILKIIENYPRSSFVILDKAGHNLQIEQADLFNELVKEWLKRLSEESV